MIYAQPGATDTAFLTDAPTGLTGTLGFKIIDDAGTVVVAHTTTGITEISAGQYAKAFVAPVDAGDYLLVWDNGPTTITEALLVTSTPPLAAAVDFVPTVAQIGALLRARTKDNDGNELGTFTDATRPTGTEAQEFIDAAVAHIAMRLGPRIPDSAMGAAQNAAALRAAYRIERAYWPEQLESDNSTFRSLWDEYNAAMAELQDTLEDENLATTSRIASLGGLSPTLSAYPDELRPTSPFPP
jgi:hypothetical protein